MKGSYDVAVAGAGILGLAHAYQFARRGLRTIVLERHPRAQGASIRNFGMIWPIGQPLGEMYQLARRSRDIWGEVVASAGLWHDPCGSLHLAYESDELQIQQEFLAQAASSGIECEFWKPEQIGERFPAVRSSGLRGGIWSPTEMTVDPRQIVAELPGWLQKTYGIEFAFNTTVLEYTSPTVTTSQGDYSAKRLAICTGADFRDLHPEAFAQSGLIPCKLQMMRSQPYGSRFRVGTMLAAGLTLRHYKSFASCPTLPKLIERFDRDYVDYGRFGIHVMLSQNGLGELILGDSHEYGSDIEPFDKAEIDRLILDYLRTFVDIPDLEIAARWHGIYAKHPSKPYIVSHPDAATMVATGVGGAGMTLSFGLAEKNVTEWLGEKS
jgi:FAD dependent oxidoreductase TIGR03364